MDGVPSSTGITKLKKSSYVFTWVIENFDSHYLNLSSEKECKISSPAFEVVHPDEVTITRWHVTMEIEEQERIKTYLRLMECPSKYLKPDGMLCIFTVHIVTKSNPKVFGKRTTHKYTECPIGRGWSNFATVEKLRTDGWLQGDSLRVRVDLNIFAPPEAVVASTQNGSKKTKLSSVLNFGSLFGAADLSDIKIQCGSETFPGHKAILGGMSDVFKRMFMCDMEEVNSGVISVTDMTPETLKTVLRYMYTGQVDHELDTDALLEILYGAEKYGLEELKHYCFQKLVACISDENVGALAVAAHLYRAEENIRLTLRKFIEPKFFELVKKPEFKKLVEKHNDAFF